MLHFWDRFRTSLSVIVFSRLPDENGLFWEPIIERSRGFKQLYQYQEKKCSSMNLGDHSLIQV